MSTISSIVSKIRKAKMAKEVRESIASGFENLDERVTSTTSTASDLARLGDNLMSNMNSMSAKLTTLTESESELSARVDEVGSNATSTKTEIETARQNDWMAFSSLNDRLNHDKSKSATLACVYNATIPSASGSGWISFENGYHDIAGYSIKDGQGIKLEKNCIYRFSLDYIGNMAKIDNVSALSMFYLIVEVDGTSKIYKFIDGMYQKGSGVTTNPGRVEYTFDTQGIDSEEIYLKLNVLNVSSNIKSFSDSKLTLIKLAEA